MPKPYILMSIITSNETVEWSFGRKFLETLCGVDEKLVPEFVSNEEKFKDPYEGVDACEAFWAPVAQLHAEGSMSEFHEDFFWKRKRAPRSSGWVVHTRRVGPRNRLAWGKIALEAQPHKKVDWLMLFRKCVHLARPKFGMLHLFTEAELGYAPFGSPENNFRRGLGQRALADGIPDLAWATYFGDGFASEVDADRIGAAGFLVEPVDAGYLVRVTSEVHDVSNDFVMFSERRAELKSLFRSGLFLIDNAPRREATA